MKTVSMGTSAREGARGERRQSLAHVLQLLLQEEDLSLSLRDGMGWSQSSTHTYTQTYMEEWAAAPRIVWGREGRKEKTSVCMYALPESLPGRSCRRGALNTTLSRHP